MNFDESYQRFLDLLERPKIRNLLKYDECNIIADQYLLAMVFIFFRRANLTKKEYNIKNFYLLLYLAHDVQEDNADFKREVITAYFAYSRQKLKKYHKQFLKNRFALFQRMRFNCLVTREMCDDVMRRSFHSVWQRVRDQNHAFYKHTKCIKCGSGF